MDEKILKAITDIRSKNDHRPCKLTIRDYFLKEGFDDSAEDIELGLNRLAQNGLIENRGAIGKDSFFILEESKSQSSKVNNSQQTEDGNESNKASEEEEEDKNKTRYTLFSDFLSLRAKVEILVKAYEGSQGTNESDLKQEITLLKKENESLRNELRRKDLLISNIEMGNSYYNFHESQNNSNIEKNCKNAFALPNKRHSTRSQLQKPSWEPIERHANRFESLPRPDTVETYASVSRNKKSFEISRKSTERKDSGVVCVTKPTEPGRRRETIINKNNARAPAYPTAKYGVPRPKQWCPPRYFTCDHDV
eukprot:gene14877-16423_t